MEGRSMSDFDLVIRSGTVVTAADTTACGIGITDGVVVALGKNLGSGRHEIYAKIGRAHV
jgi:dihydropyrimidinase